MHKHTTNYKDVKLNVATCRQQRISCRPMTYKILPQHRRSNGSTLLEIPPYYTTWSALHPSFRRKSNGFKQLPWTASEWLYNRHKRQVCNTFEVGKLYFKWDSYLHKFFFYDRWFSQTILYIHKLWHSQCILSLESLWVKRQERSKDRPENEDRTENG